MLASERMPVAKKKILLILLFQFVCSGYLKSAIPDFLRIPRTPHSNDARFADLNIQKGFNGSLYYSAQNTTMPYFCYVGSFALRCEKTGFSGLYFNLHSKTKDELTIRVKSATAVSNKSFVLKQGINEILLKSNFLKGDEIHIANTSRHPFVASSPVFFNLLPETQRELVFLISVDTLGASHMSLYGYKKETTPNIKNFARDVVVFHNAFSSSSWTVSAHMSLFTSLLEYGHQVHVKKDYSKNEKDPFVLKNRTIFPLSPAIPTLADFLAKKYLTFSFNGGANVSASFNFHGGFDSYVSNGKDMIDSKASAKLFANVQAHLEKFPFPNVFYFLHTYHVHAPYNPLPESISREEAKPKIQKFDFYSDLGGIRSIFKPCPKEFVKDVIALYDAEISSFDSAFNDFIYYLKLNRLYDKSTIILLSDHGEEFLEHSSWVHSSNLYADQIWIPLLIKFPFQEHKGKNIKTPVSLVDVMPTLLACKGFPVPGKIHGQSLMDLVNGKKDKRSPVIASLFRSKPEEYFPGEIAIIQDNLKLIYSEPWPKAAAKFFKYPPPAQSSFELFDLTHDRFEKANIMNSHRNDPAIKGMLKNSMKFCALCAGLLSVKTMRKALQPPLSS